jgi:crossover junction endodeoxyribonuclease RusA
MMTYDLSDINPGDVASDRRVFTLPGMSINRYLRHLQNGRTLISAAGRHYREVVRIAVYATDRTLPAAEPWADPVHVAIVWTPPDRRRRDVDNVIKPLLDALTHAGVWADDSQVYALTIVRVRPQRPGNLVVTITRVREGAPQEEGAWQSPN